MAQATPDAEQVVEEYVDVYNGEYEHVADVVAESATIFDPGAPEGEMHGPDELEAHLREIQTGFPDFTITIEERLCRDDVVMEAWTVTATHDGEFNGIQPTGREIALEGMSKTVVEDGKVRENRVYYDFQSFLEQLGLAE